MSNRINSNFADPSVRHLPIDPPEILEIGLACQKEPAPAAEAFLKFIRTQLPRGEITALQETALCGCGSADPDTNYSA